MLSKREVELQEAILATRTEVDRALKVANEFNRKWKEHESAMIEPSATRMRNLFAAMWGGLSATLRPGMAGPETWGPLEPRPEAIARRAAHPDLSEARLELEFLKREISALKESHRKTVCRLAGQIGWQKSQVTQLRRRLGYGGKSTGRGGAST